MNTTSARLDSFTDAAFAFAVTMLVAGGGFDRADIGALTRLIPAFGIGYAILGMFWYAHVRWRRFRGDGDWLSVLLTFLLVFIALIYVFPLGAMARDLSAYSTGYFHDRPLPVATLFTVYGFGFCAMSATIAALFWDAARADALDPALRPAVKGEALIYMILCGTAILSTALAMVGGMIAMFAPWVYATLPVTIGVFAVRWRWA